MRAPEACGAARARGRRESREISSIWIRGGVRDGVRGGRGSLMEADQVSHPGGTLRRRSDVVDNVCHLAVFSNVQFIGKLVPRY